MKRTWLSGVLGCGMLETKGYKEGGLKGSVEWISMTSWWNRHSSDIGDKGSYEGQQKFFYVGVKVQVHTMVL